MRLAVQSAEQCADRARLAAHLICSLCSFSLGAVRSELATDRGSMSSCSAAIVLLSSVTLMHACVTMRYGVTITSAFMRLAAWLTHHDILL